MKRTQLTRKTPLRRSTSMLKRTGRLRSRSPSKAADDAKYRKAKAEHFAANPKCQHPDGCTKSLLKGDLIDLHHRAGRNGPLLYCKRYFATACRAHHNLAKDKPSESRGNGWIVDVSSEEVRQLRLAELDGKLP